MKKQFILIAMLVILVGVVSVLSMYKYLDEPKGITLEQAIAQRDEAQDKVNLQQVLINNDSLTIDNLKGDNYTLTTTNATLCAQIKAAKLIQPLCK